MPFYTETVSRAFIHNTGMYVGTSLVGALIFSIVLEIKASFCHFHLYLCFREHYVKKGVVNH